MYKHTPLKFLTIMTLIAGSFILFASEKVYSAGNCPRGLNYCAPGSYGPGGCYKSGYASCTAGRVCSSGLQACKPGKYGKGGCYKPVYANCTSGLICGADTRACIKSNRAYCYNPYYRRCK